MTVAEERQPLLGDINGDVEQGGGERNTDSETLTWRERTAEKLEAPSTHKTIIFLIAIDACCVLADLVYTFLSPEQDCANQNPSYVRILSESLIHTITLTEDHEPTWLTVLAHISLAINTLFLLEVPLALWCFGPAFYNPFPKSLTSTGAGGDGGGEAHGYPYAGLHLFDALVVITTFVLEVVLRGREAELAGLLVLLRLWRLVKLVGGLAVGAGELQEELSNKLAETEQLLREERARVEKLEEENARLLARLVLVEPSTSVAANDT